MGVMDKFLNYMKLNDMDDDDGYYDDGDYDEYDEPVEPKAPSVVKRMNVVKEEADEYEKPPVKKAQTSKITQMRQTSAKKLPVGSGMEVCVMKPSSIEDAREITDTLLSNRTVVLNLEGIDVDVAQRIIDFTSGSCYAIGGNLQKISHYIFIITPSSVDISGDFQDIFGGAFDSPIGGLN
ncbi:MAG: cell division protein SepF [Lachnospiraceae bacterium]|nr:cell division protein SepF [Lachnospiraceae bacterium]